VSEQPKINTDRELWRGPDEGNGDYYADSIHVTASGAIGINCGGLVIVRPLREWHTSAAELSRAKGEIDAAHVVLTAAGVHRSEGQALQDRIASYIGPMESKLEEAEDRATAAEQERDTVVDGCVVVYRDLRAKLAAAEQREAEKDRRIAELVAHARYALPPYTGQRAGSPKFNPSAAKLILEVLGVPRKALASPSTPSPGEPT
jgi:hypothetical protein